MNTIVHIFSLLLLMTCPAQLFSAEKSKAPEMCTYDVSIWNTNAGKVTRTRKVKKNYSDITDRERDRSGTGCTVCIEDQTKI